MRPFSGKPLDPFAGSTSATCGSERVTILKETALLANPFSVTTTFPVVAPSGTGTAMLVGDQLVGMPATPLNVTVLDP